MKTSLFSTSQVYKEHQKIASEQGHTIYLYIKQGINRIRIFQGSMILLCKRRQCNWFVTIR